MFDQKPHIKKQTKYGLPNQEIAQYLEWLDRYIPESSMKELYTFHTTDTVNFNKTCWHTAGCLVLGLVLAWLSF